MYNEVAPEDQRLAIRERRLWSSSSSPQIGSARIQFRSADADESGNEANPGAES
jgi:hypothetical protein